MRNLRSLRVVYWVNISGVLCQLTWVFPDKGPLSSCCCDSWNPFCLVIKSGCLPEMLSEAKRLRPRSRLRPEL